MSAGDDQQQPRAAPVQGQQEGGDGGARGRQEGGDGGARGREREPRQRRREPRARAPLFSASGELNQAVRLDLCEEGLRRVQRGQAVEVNPAVPPQEDAQQEDPEQAHEEDPAQAQDHGQQRAPAQHEEQRPRQDEGAHATRPVLSVRARERRETAAERLFQEILAQRMREARSRFTWDQDGEMLRRSVSADDYCAMLGIDVRAVAYEVACDFGIDHLAQW